MVHGGQSIAKKEKKMAMEHSTFLFLPYIVHNLNRKLWAMLNKCQTALPQIWLNRGKIEVNYSTLLDTVHQALQK